jgi:outer membrane biosynthesis protein TonB
MRAFSCEAHRRLTGSVHRSPRVARSHHDDHENAFTQRASGARGSARPRTAALLAAGFAIGAVTIGTMSLALSPADPPAVRPIELMGPADEGRSGDRSERRERRRGTERRERVRRQARRGVAPPAPETRQQPRQEAPPSSSPAPAPSPAQPSPPPGSEPEPQPAPAPQPQPAPAPPPPPAEDDNNDPDDDSGGDN